MAATKLLLVDPDRIRHEDLATQFKEAGLKVLSAWDSDEALSLLGDHSSVEGVATAWELPEGPALKLLRRMLIKEEFEGAIVLYDCPRRKFAEDKLEEWADPATFIVLETPVEGEQVLEAVQELLD